MVCQQLIQQFHWDGMDVVEVVSGFFSRSKEANFLVVQEIKIVSGGSLQKLEFWIMYALIFHLGRIK